MQHSRSEAKACHANVYLIDVVGGGEMTLIIRRPQRAHRHFIQKPICERSDRSRSFLTLILKPPRDRLRRNNLATPYEAAEAATEHGRKLVQSFQYLHASIRLHDDALAYICSVLHIGKRYQHQKAGPTTTMTTSHSQMTGAPVCGSVCPALPQSWYQG